MQFADVVRRLAAQRAENQDLHLLVQGVTGDGTLIVVHEDASSPSYTDCFTVMSYAAGDAAPRIIAVLSASRLRDGGTTIIHTEDGRLYSPAPGRGELDTWNGKPLDSVPA